jgi:hypothetical protein
MTIIMKQIIISLLMTITMSSLGQSLSLYVNSTPTCGTGYGGAYVLVSGGVPPYTYLWSSVPPQTTPYAFNLTIGTYYITVTDSVLNTATDSAVIFYSPGVSCSICNIQYDTITGLASITACAIGGTPPFQYMWSCGETTQTITNVSSGGYCLTISDYYSCWCDTCITVADLTVIEKLEENNFISISPNPNKGIFSIDLSNLNEENLSIELINAIGQVVYNKEIIDLNIQKLNIDIAELPQGFYFLRIQSRRIIFNRKILKE